MIKKGDIVVANVLLSNATFKVRPVLVINFFYPYNDLFVCGISSQVHQYSEKVSYLISEKDNYFKKTGLVKPSIVRLNYLATTPKDMVDGKIGFLPDPIYNEILNKLIELIRN